ncbi:hypothetical protein A0256_13680 [Mucilaginibacter sp. PAMC 26640]|nr:hypothetical protein A0256_13680 [Mucilaginibacter sp. PAMC 26640]
MCLTNDRLIEIGADAHLLDGGFDHDEIIRNLAYTADNISSNTVGEEHDADDMRCAIANLNAIVQATAYISLMRDKMRELRKGERNN